MQLIGSEGFYTNTYEYEVKEDCPVCSSSVEPRVLVVNRDMTLSDVLRKLKEDPAYQLKNPSIFGKQNLYMGSGPLETTLRPNLSKTLVELDVDEGDVVGITDRTLVNPMNLKIKFG